MTRPCYEIWKNIKQLISIVLWHRKKSTGVIYYRSTISNFRILFITEFKGCSCKFNPRKTERSCCSEERVWE